MAGHYSITDNLWKCDPGVIILYRIVTRGSLYPRAIFYMTPATNSRKYRTIYCAVGGLCLLLTSLTRVSPLQTAIASDGDVEDLPC